MTQGCEQLGIMPPPRSEIERAVDAARVRVSGYSDSERKKLREHAKGVMERKAFSEPMPPPLPSAACEAAFKMRGEINAELKRLRKLDPKHDWEAYRGARFALLQVRRMLRKHFHI